MSNNPTDSSLFIPEIDIGRKVSGDFPALRILPTTIRKNDCLDEDKSEDQRSQWGIICHIFVVSTGSGVLTVPRNFVAVDYVAGSTVIFLIIWLYVYCAQMALWSEYEICKMAHEPYPPNSDQVFVVFKNDKLFVRLLAILYRCLSYLAFVTAWFGYSCYDYHLLSRSAEIFLENVCERSFSNTVILGLLFPALLSLCCIRTLRQLVPFSLAGSIFNVTSFLFVIYSAVTDPSPWQLKRNFGSVNNLAILAGSVLNDVNGLGLLMLYKSELKHPKQFTSRFGILSMSFIPISCFYVAYVLVCCLKYGDHVRGNVFKNLPQNRLPGQLAMLCGIVGQIFQFPLIIFVPFDTLWSCVMEKVKYRRKFWEYSLRVVLVTAAFVMSAGIPRASLILSFFGGICAVVEILLIPPIVETLVAFKTYERRFDLIWIFWKNILLIGLAFWLVLSQTTVFVDAVSDDSVCEGSAFWVHLL